MKKKEYPKRLEKKLNEITDAYDFNSYPECESCPLHKDGCSCVGCIETLDSNIDNINEVEE